jgi:hypothetical protein
VLFPNAINGVAGLEAPRGELMAAALLAAIRAVVVETEI